MIKFTLMKVCLFLLVLLHIFYFSPYYFSEKLLIQEDLLELIIPLKFEAALMWKKGIAPFWDEKISNGFPLLSNPHSTSLYPFLLPLILFPSFKTFTFLCLFHHLSFLIGCFLFANSLLKNPYLSLFLSNFISYNGIIIRNFSFCNPILGIMHLPWTLFFFYKYLKNNKKINLILASIFFSFSILAGFDLAPFIFSFSLLILTVFLNYKRIIPLLICILLAFLLSAPQTIPTLLYLPHTTRGSEQTTTFGFFSLHPFRLIDIFIPNFNCNHSFFSKDYLWATILYDKEMGLYHKIYFGMVNILFLFSIRPLKKRWLFFIISIIFLLLAFGRYFPLHFLISKLPIISYIRYPEKFLFFLLIFLFLFFTFALKDYKKISLLPTIFLSSLIFLIIFLNKLTNSNLIKSYVYFSAFHPKDSQIPLSEFFIKISFLISFFLFLFFIFFRKSKIFLPLLVIISFFDLYINTNYILTPFSKKNFFSPVLKILKSSQNVRVMWHYEDIKKFYFINEQISYLNIKSLYPHIGILFGISYSFSSLIDQMEVKMPSIIKKEDLDLWGVSHIIALGKKTIKGKKPVYLSKEFSVTLYNDNPTYLWFINEKDKTKIPLKIPKIKNPSHIKIEVENKEKGILWFGFNNIPGWKVYVNNKKREIANKDLKALNVFLDPGKNKVEFIYRPAGFFIAMTLFFFGLLLILIIFTFNFL